MVRCAACAQRPARKALAAGVTRHYRRVADRALARLALRSHLGFTTRSDDQLPFDTWLRGDKRPKVTAAFEVHIRVAKKDQTVLDLRIFMQKPVIGVLHSLQAKNP